MAKQLQKYETENLINETPAMQEKTAAVRLWWLDVVQSLVVPLMIMKSANTQVIRYCDCGMGGAVYTR